MDTDTRVRRKPPQHTVETSDGEAIRRRRELSRLLPMWPKEISDLSLSGRRRVVDFLARALRHERRRARAGHWSYDLARHSNLFRLWRCEKVALEKLSPPAIAAGAAPITKKPAVRRALKLKL